MYSQAFPKQQRLLKSAEYRRVFAAHTVVRCQGLFGYIVENPYNSPRLGLVVAKHQINKAVKRNRIKRLVRESFRRRREHLPAVDMIIVAQQRLVRLSNKEIFGLIEKLWQQLIELRLSSHND